eukprot:CAMPEP_0182860202 /NCGR_PEP_ID=MMETSP0034_2-20130328/4783_1 /TAXON_ID=156128 /ORGANISM="Nephroselmis pyriformis, Strain CCMP717" /LENGTH=75 /DNA_ID=CAMNT_0024991967 /DNA_START=272 /DNA_END=499 /DNA_ORIENTATION=+
MDAKRVSPPPAPSPGGSSTAVRTPPSGCPPGGMHDPSQCHSPPKMLSFAPGSLASSTTSGGSLPADSAADFAMLG